MNEYYQSPLSQRYASKEMQALFSNDKKFTTWRRLWIALAESEKELGLDITEEQIEELKAHALDINYDVAKAREKEVRHDVMSHVYAYGEQCPNAKGIIHLGATSCYVGDNTDIIIMRDALKVIRRKLINVIAQLSDFAMKYKDMPCLAYTHLQPAQLTTVGKRATLWINELLMDLIETERRISDLKLLGSKGTTGTQASFMELFEGDTGKIKELEKMIAEEMEKFGVNLWLAPGMNIHRNPLCGRNFEYYSEDPLLAGSLAAAVTKGVQSKAGCGVTIKHFACNNQEDNRMGVDVHLSERALREIYCRGFEIAIKESKPVAIMSSYNLVNGVHAANSKDLCTRIVRDEWGFEGVIMSDWNTTEPKDGSIPWKCTAAGNDIIMPGSENDHKSILDGYRSGELSEEEIRICARRVLKLIDKLRSSYLVMSK